MTDWVHCNTCFRQPGSGPKFALTNCGHIYCSDCVEAGTKAKCRMCGQPCTTIALSAKMKPEVELFFTDPTEIVKKQQKQLITVLDFQKNHRQRLTAQRREERSKCGSFVNSAKEEMKEMECEVHRLKEENRKLRSLISGSPGISSSSKISQRPLTPGRSRRCSPSSSSSSASRMVHQTPSPSKNRGSPFTRPYPTTPTPMDVSKGPMQSPHSVTPGPARYSIRTPPSGGRMGTIQTPILGGNTNALTPKNPLLRQPGHNPPGTPNNPSPLNNSPGNYHQRSGFSSQEYRTGSVGASGDAGRKQIQLNFTPHRRPPVLTASLGRSMPISASQP